MWEHARTILFATPTTAAGGWAIINDKRGRQQPGWDLHEGGGVRREG